MEAVKDEIRSSFATFKSYEYRFRLYGIMSQPSRRYDGVKILGGRGEKDNMIRTYGDFRMTEHTRFYVLDYFGANIFAYTSPAIIHVTRSNYCLRVLATATAASESYKIMCTQCECTRMCVVLTRE